MGAFFKTRRHISVLFLNTVFGDKYQLVNYRSYLYKKKNSCLLVTTGQIVNINCARIYKCSIDLKELNNKDSQ